MTQVLLSTVLPPTAAQERLNARLQAQNLDLRQQLQVAEASIRQLQDELDVLRQQVEDQQSVKDLSLAAELSFDKELADADGRSRLSAEEKAIIIELGEKVRRGCAVRRKK